MDNILEQSRAILSTTPQRWETLAGALPRDLLTRTPAPGEWSALECLQHLLDTERVFQFRVRAFLAGEDFPAFDPMSEGSAIDEQVSPAAMVSRFVTLREESLALLERVSPADLARRARHQELGPVTLEELVHEWGAHDLVHTVQAEVAIMQPFIDGCGPWQVYFVEHMMGTTQESPVTES